jgi:hypothetical protein
VSPAPNQTEFYSRLALVEIRNKLIATICTATEFISALSLAASAELLSCSLLASRFQWYQIHLKMSVIMIRRENFHSLVLPRFNVKLVLESRFNSLEKKHLGPVLWEMTTIGVEQATEEANIQVVCRIRPFNDREKGLGLDGTDGYINIDKNVISVRWHECIFFQDPQGSESPLTFFLLPISIADERLDQS